MQLKTTKGSQDVAYQRDKAYRAKAGQQKHPNDVMDELYGESEVMRKMRLKEEQRDKKEVKVDAPTSTA